MPTFRSIGIHPDLRTRLVTSTIHGGGGPNNTHNGTATNTNNNHTDYTSFDTSSQPDQPQQQHMIVATPQALLSRNPATLRILQSDGQSSRPIPHAKVQTLRYDVAVALIDGDGKGANATTTNSFDGNKGVRVPGTVTALQLLWQSQQQHHGTAADSGLTTGSQALDVLVALPKEHQMAHDHTVLSPATPPLPRPRHSSTTTQIQTTTGIPFGYVTQFSGPPASGKTQLALTVTMLMMSTQQQPTGDVHDDQTWYLCSGSLPHDRLYQMCHENTNNTNQSNNNKTNTLHGAANADRVIRNTRFVRCTHEHQVLSALAQLEESLQQQRERRRPTTSPAHHHSSSKHRTLLVMDSCSGCLTAGGDDTMMSTVGGMIQRLTRQYTLATVLLNGTVSNRSRGSSGNTEHATITTLAIGRATKPALGKQWSRVADIHVWMEADAATPGQFRATLDRHTAKQCYPEDTAAAVEFTCTGRGIVDANGGVDAV